MRHIRLMIVAFAAALALSVVAVASAAAATVPDILQTGGVVIPAGTPVTASNVAGTKPIFKGKGLEVECEKVETVEGGTLKNNGEVIGTTEKSISIRLLFMGCVIASTKTACTTAGSAEGSILTLLLLETLYENAAKEGFSYVRNAESTGEEDEKELAKFTCGEKTTAVSGCVPAIAKVNGAGNMLVGKALESATVPGLKGKCEQKAFGTKSVQVAEEEVSFNKEGKLLLIELKL